MTEPIKFFVHGIPQPKGSWKAMAHFKDWSGRAVLMGASFTSAALAKLGRNWTCKVMLRPDAKRSKAWENQVKAVAGRYAPSAPWDLPIDIELHFVMPKPKKPKFNIPATKPDWDKLSRAVCDALTDVIYKDDSRICKALVTERYADAGEPTGVAIMVAPAWAAQQELI